MVDILYCKYLHSPIQHIICNRNVFTNFLPCSHTINLNNETCLVTCAVSLTCATWPCMHSFSFDLPLNQDKSIMYELGHYTVCTVCSVRMYRVYCMHCTYEFYTLHQHTYMLYSSIIGCPRELIAQSSRGSSPCRSQVERRGTRYWCVHAAPHTQYPAYIYGMICKKLNGCLLCLFSVNR